jgi:hypothetical protein
VARRLHILGIERRARRLGARQSRRLFVVMEKLDILVRFWDLRARYETLGVPLTRAEGLELLSLLQLLVASAEPMPVESIDPSERGLPVLVTAGAGFLAGDLKDLSSDRLVIGAVGPLPTGQRTILYVADAVSGVEYSVPCVVLWSKDDEPCLIGLAPDGVPTRSEFTVPVTGFFRSPLGIGSVGHRVQA